MHVGIKKNTPLKSGYFHLLYTQLQVGTDMLLL